MISLPKFVKNFNSGSFEVVKWLFSRIFWGQSCNFAKYWILILQENGRLDLGHCIKDNDDKVITYKKIDFLTFLFSDNSEGGEKWYCVCILFKWELIEFRKSVNGDVSFCKDHLEEGILKVHIRRWHLARGGSLPFFPILLYMSSEGRSWKCLPWERDPP